MFAVSKKLIPTFNAFLIIFLDSFSSNNQSCIQISGSPKLIQPKQILDTSRPVFPNFSYFTRHPPLIIENVLLSHYNKQFFYCYFKMTSHLLSIKILVSFEGED